MKYVVVWFRTADGERFVCDYRRQIPLEWISPDDEISAPQPEVDPDVQTYGTIDENALEAGESTRASPSAGFPGVKELPKPADFTGGDEDFCEVCFAFKLEHSAHCRLFGRTDEH